MNYTDEKIELLVSQKRVKLHIFEPSNRKIWTVVGKSEEHWLDPESNFCSCQAYYFGRINGKDDCYHLLAQKLAQKQTKFDVIKFSDEEYYDFVRSIIKGL